MLFPPRMAFCLAEKSKEVTQSFLLKLRYGNFIRIYYVNTRKTLKFDLNCPLSTILVYTLYEKHAKYHFSTKEEIF